MNIYKELSFAMEYDQFYQSDGGRAVDMAEKAVISDLLLQVDSREMLELGCGTGHWTAFFSEKGFRVTAVDQSPAMLEQARKRVIPEVQWVDADAAHLPFSDGQFELITAITLFEFVEDRNALLSEIGRLLKPGGFLIVGWLDSLSEIGRQRKVLPLSVRHISTHRQRSGTTSRSWDLRNFSTLSIMTAILNCWMSEMTRVIRIRHLLPPSYKKQRIMQITIEISYYVLKGDYAAPVKDLSWCTIHQSSC